MLSYSRNTLKPWDAPRGWTGSTGASTSVPGRRGVGDTDIDPAWADEAFADDGADLAVVRGGVEPPTFRFSGASAASLHVAGRGLMGHLAAQTMAGCRLLWLDACRRWLPVGLPGTRPADARSDDAA